MLIILKIKRVWAYLNTMFLRVSISILSKTLSQDIYEFEQLPGIKFCASVFCISRSLGSANMNQNKYGE